MRPSLHDAWWRLATLERPRGVSDALAITALEAASRLYRGVVFLRNAAYDVGWLRAVRLRCPVVSVGNLTVGGTGKTACVELIVRHLAASGRRIAVLSRGYGGRRDPYWLRWEQGRLHVGGGPEPGTDPSTRRDGTTGSLRTESKDDSQGLRGLADEPQLLARHLEGVPVLVGARRDRSGERACREFGAELLVLDDGFQYRQLHRDCDVVLVHGRTPFSGWGLLPRGPMREPLDALRRADVILITKADESLGTLGALTERLRSFNAAAVIAAAVHEPVTLLDPASGMTETPQQLSGRRVGLLSSIGDPAGFEETVRRLHATIAWHQALPDHHRYAATDLRRLTGGAGGVRPEVIVTTEKDWVRLRPVLGDAPLAAPLRVLGIRMRLLSGTRELDDRLARL